MVVDIAIVLGAIVSPVIRVLVTKLAENALNEIKDFCDVESNLMELACKASNVECKLNLLSIEDFEDSTFKPWCLSWLQPLQELKELCYIVDDIIDDFNLEITKKKRSNHMDDKVVRDIIKMSMKKWDIPRKIRALIDRMNFVNKQVEEKFRSPVSSSGRTPRRARGSQPSLISSPICDLPKGRKIEKENIINKILDMLDDGGGICIVGMAGLGKTVLAHSIINDNSIKRQFDAISWVYAPEDDWRSVRHIVIEQIVCLNDNNNASQQSSSSSSSSSSTGGRSLFLVDDLQDVGPVGWQNIRARLVQRRRTVPTLFIITTRDPRVSEITETALHYLPTLSVEDCKEIISSRMPSNLSTHRRQWLNAKVDSIAQKCGGLPLAADAISLSIRSHSSSKQKFISVVSDLEKNEIWTQGVFLRDVLPYLGFDETSLPRNLNKFLAYFSLFPPDHNFDQHKLSQLWMAEGYIHKAQRSTMRSSSPSIDHFESLVSRSLLQSPKLSPQESVVESLSYQMHSFVHRFAEEVASSTHFRLKEGKASSLPKHNIHHFSSCCPNIPKETLQAIKNKFVRMRTFIVLGNYVTTIQHADPSSLSKLIYLRVLSLSGSDIKELPETISNLKHLRYLDLSYTVIERLPIGVCKLLGLQVLKLNSCTQLECLPKNFGDLISLTYLDLDNSNLLSTPANLGNLTNLETLIPAFIVEREGGRSISELKNMNSLGGSIKITKLENVIKKSEAKKAMLHQKSEIRKLNLEWTNNSNQNSPTAEVILTSLQPNNNLRKLRVVRYNGINFPTWVNTLKDLSSLCLYDCPSCTEFPQLGMLPLLKSLKIEKMCKVEKVYRSSHRSHSKEAKDRDYPALQSLEICNMKRLQRWYMLLDMDMPCLHVLRVKGCPELNHLPMISRFSSSSKGLIIEKCENLSRVGRMNNIPLL